MSAMTKGEETRARILERAAEAFARDGYSGASLNELIRATGLTKGAFYFHFDSKEALALEVFRDRQAAWFAAITEQLEGGGSPLDRLAAATSALAALMESDPAVRCIGRIAEELAEDPRLGPEVGRLQDRWVEMVAGLLREAVAAGEVRPDLPVEEVADVAVAAFIGLERVTEMRGDRGLARRVEVFLRLFLDAVTG
jgi:AcrR family transcriptional regulator